MIEGARRHPSVVNSGNNPGPVDHPQGQTRTLWYLRPDGWKRKKKNHDGTRFVLSLAAVSASLTSLCVHSPLGVRDVVALETTASVVAWAFPRQAGRGRASFDQPSNCSLLSNGPNPRPSASLISLTYCSEILMAAQGQCIYHGRSLRNHISPSPPDPHLRRPLSLSNPSPSPP